MLESAGEEGRAGLEEVRVTLKFFVSPGVSLSIESTLREPYKNKTYILRFDPCRLFNSNENISFTRYFFFFNNIDVFFFFFYNIVNYYKYIERKYDLRVRANHKRNRLKSLLCKKKKKKYTKSVFYYFFGIFNNFNTFSGYKV